MNYSKYDEFGNFIGDDSDSSSEESDTKKEDASSKVDESKSQGKNDYVNVKHEFEDRQDISEPIIKLNKKKIIAKDCDGFIPESVYDSEFLYELLKSGHSTRNVCFVGALGHGKTTVIDCLIEETHPNILDQLITRKDITNQVVGEGRKVEKLGWTDRIILEKRRIMSITTEIATIAVKTLSGKTIALNAIDTPGHVDFLDQVYLGLSAADGVIFCVDCIEGLIAQSERLLRSVCRKGIRVVLCITKIDRMILESKYDLELFVAKITRILLDVNIILKKYDYELLSPEKGNVIFTSALFGLCFSTLSIGLIYQRYMKPAKEMARRLWGNFYVENGIIKSGEKDGCYHPFPTYILNPLYTVISCILSKEPKEWTEELKVKLSSKDLNSNTSSLLKMAFKQIYGGFESLSTAIYDFLPAPPIKVVSESEKLSQVVFFSPDKHGNYMRAIVKVHEGTLEPGDEVNVIFTDYLTDDKQYSVASIPEIFLSTTRYYCSVPVAYPGMIVLIEELNVKGLCQLSSTKDVLIPPVFMPPSLFKVAVEPLNPKQHNEMVQAIDMAKLQFPSLQTIVTNNKELHIMGTGEMYLDCVMYFLRNIFSEIEIKVSDPFVVFKESVREKSVTICYANIGDNLKIGVTAEPISPSILVSDMEENEFRFRSHDEIKEKLLKTGFDEFSTENFWVFGPDTVTGPNILVNEAFEANEEHLQSDKDFLIRGFKWATRIGPLCEEVIRGVLFKICDYQYFGQDPKPRSLPAHVYPGFRKALHASMIAATPCLVEPIYKVEILTQYNAIPIIKTLIEKRRGRFLFDPKPIGGTFITVVMAEVPLIDSFGLETEIRSRTTGLSFPQLWFSHWERVDGDPLDATYQIKPLEPAPKHFLSRDFTVKTRRRKGMPENIRINEFCDNDLIMELAKLKS